MAGRVRGSVERADRSKKNNKVQLAYLRHAVIAEVMNMFQAKCELFQNQHSC